MSCGVAWSSRRLRSRTRCATACGTLTPSTTSGPGDPDPVLVHAPAAPDGVSLLLPAALRPRRHGRTGDATRGRARLVHVLRPGCARRRDRRALRHAAE